MNFINFYVAVRFILSLYTITFTVIQTYCIMATGTGNLSSDITMESLMSKIRTLKVELTAIQGHEGLQNLSLDKCDWERTTQSHLPSMSRAYNTKIGYFRNLLGENFQAWRSQFQVIIKFNRWSNEEAKSMVYTYMKYRRTHHAHAQKQRQRGISAADSDEDSQFGLSKRSKLI